MLSRFKEVVSVTILIEPAALAEVPKMQHLVLRDIAVGGFSSTSASPGGGGGAALSAGGSGV
jgi:hypothetical protein